MINSIEFLKNKSFEELNVELCNLRKEYLNLRIQLSSGKLKKTHLIRLCRKNIARIKNFLNYNKGVISVNEKKKEN